MNDGTTRNLISYITGFVFSLLTTLIAYFLVSDHVNSQHERFSHHLLIPVLAALAVVQFVVQLIYFLHLGRESRPRWRLLVFIYMIGVMGIIVVGSIWIMNNLNYNMMSPEHLKVFMHENEGL